MFEFCVKKLMVKSKRLTMALISLVDESAKPEILSQSIQRNTKSLRSEPRGALY